ncbi:hypothetical protein HMPREF1141_2395 [Clostridium sp. MSTE9]|nr:hypothetical protein HMPREF1141_2395 [Clostridium sp. MSTE9]
MPLLLYGAFVIVRPLGCHRTLFRVHRRNGIALKNEKRCVVCPDVFSLWAPFSGEIYLALGPEKQSAFLKWDNLNFSQSLV